jgi:hypothetical protein
MKENIYLYRQKKKLFSFLLQIILILLLFITSFADWYRYNKIANLKVENEKIIVRHYHNWSDSKYTKWYKMYPEEKRLTDMDINYAYIECFEKKNGNMLFKKASPALTNIYISTDSRYIIGISNIKVINPYQFVVYDRCGDIIYKKHIAPTEAKLTLSEFQSLKQSYSSQTKFLEELRRITLFSNFVYIDFLSIGMPEILGKAWDFLIKKEAPNYLSKNFGESVTNYVTWYKDEDPKIELRYNNEGQLIGVSLLDPKSQRFEIPIEVNKSKEKAQCKSKCH